jgi:hypothetical protein
VQALIRPTRASVAIDLAPGEPNLSEKMTPPTRTWLLAGALLLGAVGEARAGAPQPLPLSPFAPDKMAALAPLLLDRDLVLLEPDGNGALKQLIALALVVAPPDLVREVVIHPERYSEFVRNMKRSRVAAEPGGTLWHEYVISYGVYAVDGHHRYVFLPKGPGDAVAPVEMYDADPGGTRHYRWEFLAAGGATVLALYGSMRITRDRFTSRYIDQAPTLESGFALIPHLTLLYSMKSRAEQLSGKKAALPTASKVDWEFLLDHGAVIVLMSAGGRLREVNLVERSTASADALFAVAGAPSRWSTFVPTMRRSTAVGGSGDFPVVEIQQSLPLMSWTSRWAYRQDRSSVELLALDGDLRGGHLHWDVSRDRQGRSLLILRAMADFQKGSVLLREVYKLEPYLEFGFDVAMNLLLLQSVRHRAEQLTHASSSATSSYPSAR